MFVSFLKKELLQFVRRPQELLVLLLMPFVLISILGFALGSVMNGEEQPVQITVGFVEHSSEKEQLVQFSQSLRETGMPEEQITQLSAQMEETLPVTILKQKVFGHPEVQRFVTVEQLNPSEIKEAKAQNKYAAIIEVPEQYTLELLQALRDDTVERPSLTLHLNEGRELGAQIVEEMITVFQSQYSTLALIGQAGLLQREDDFQVEPVTATVKTVDQRKTIGAMAYYTVGMSVMFVLFTAASVGSLAYYEKKHHLFDRMRLAHISIWQYMWSVFTTSVVLAFIQLFILFGGTALFYEVRFPNSFTFLLVTLAISMTVGGIGALLMALNYRLDSIAATNLFQSAFVAILAFFGGSFFEVKNLSDGLGKMGAWTPNGAGMNAYLKLLQGESISAIAFELSYLSVLSMGLLVIAVLIFPRKGALV